MTIKVALQGVGPIGQGTAKLILEDPELEIVGAIDINLEYVGKDLGALLGTDYLGIKVTDDAEALFSKLQPHVLVLATCSKLEKIIPSLEVAIKNGVNVVSPAEELFYPESISEEMARGINGLAEEYGVRILGGGVNPGCLMDAYPLYLFKSRGYDLASLDTMMVYRWDDTVARRLPLLEKTGAGLTPEEFREKVRDEKIGHVGLKMSAAYLADNIGLENYTIQFVRSPLVSSISRKPVNGQEIPAGKVTGLHEVCNVVVNEQVKIKLDLRMAVGIEKRNCTYINTTHIDYSNIVNGDEATHRILKYAIKPVVKGKAGLNQVGYVPDPTKLLKV